MCVFFKGQLPYSVTFFQMTQLMTPYSHSVTNTHFHFQYFQSRDPKRKVALPSPTDTMTRQGPSVTTEVPNSRFNTRLGLSLLATVNYAISVADPGFQRTTNTTVFHRKTLVTFR